MAKRLPPGRPTAERRLTATQVAGFIVLPLVCMVTMVVLLLAMKG